MTFDFYDWKFVEGLFTRPGTAYKGGDRLKVDYRGDITGEQGQNVIEFDTNERRSYVLAQTVSGVHVRVLVSDVVFETRITVILENSFVGHIDGNLNNNHPMNLTLVVQDEYQPPGDQTHYCANGPDGCEECAFFEDYNRRGLDGQKVFLKRRRIPGIGEPRPYRKSYQGYNPDNPDPNLFNYKKEVK